MPRASASHTSSTASGRMTNCGSITPLMISVASTLRFSRVSATWISARFGSGSDSCTQIQAMRTSMPRNSPSRNCTTPMLRSRSLAGIGSADSPARNMPAGVVTW